jgi:hypothetical protein
VTVVPVVCVSSLHPQTNQTGPSAAGRSRIPRNKDMALERIDYLSIIGSQDVAKK